MVNIFSCFIKNARFPRYIEWSLIEPKPGVFDFSGNNNITHYIQIAQEEGLLVILRPAPFIDSGNFSANFG